MTFNTLVVEENLKLIQIFSILKEFTDNSFLVGGCVRDLLLNKSPKDFDIVTDFDIFLLAPILQDNGWIVKETGTVFKILFVSEPDNVKEWKESEARENGWCLSLFRTPRPEKNLQNFEIANFRRDSETSDGRRPESVEVIEFEETKSINENILEDALRRDFTVNSLFLDPFTMQIQDPTGNGVSDIETKTLRFNLNPKDRIEEDFLRVFRFFRFIRKGFNPEVNSLNACRELFEVAHRNTAPERIKLELEKMVDSKLFDSPKGSLKLNSTTVSDCNCFVLDTENKVISFNGRPKDLILKNNLSIFRLFGFMVQGFRPSPNTLSGMREHFRHVHALTEPNDVRLIIENILQI